MKHEVYNKKYEHSNVFKLRDKDDMEDDEYK